MEDITNDFSKLERVVDYTWPSSPHKVNWLTVHRSQPFIAYVVMPDYHEAVRTGRKMVEEIDPQKQMVRIHNYHNQKRGLVKPGFTAPIKDLAFALSSLNIGHENRLAITDRFANIQIHEFITSDDASKSITTLKLLEIISEEKTIYSEVRLAWCPGGIMEKDEPETEDEDFEDLGMNLGISFDNNVEIYSVGHIIRNGIRQICKEELEFTSPERKVIRDPDNQRIISLSLSNDLTTVCAASKDNRVRFYEISDASVRQVHDWQPMMKPGDRLSCIFFLDDFNELLANQDCHFWGHVLVGTTKGDLTIWNLNIWKPIQKISLNCPDDDSEADFEFRIDVTSHVLVAVHGKSAFLLLLDFFVSEDVRGKDSSHVSRSGSDETKLLVKEPKIRKITRFQLYNPILSFYVKRPYPHEVEIFWMTHKSLEKCVINVDNLLVDDSTSNVFLSLDDFSKLSKDYEARPIYSSMGVNGAENSESRRITLKPFETTTSTLAEIFNMNSIQHDSKICIPSSSNEAQNVSAFGDTSKAQRAPTPASREVANYLSTDHDREKLVGSYGGLLDPRCLETYFKDFVTENMLKSLETNILSQVNSKIDELKTDFFKISNDVTSIRAEMKDHSQLKASTKIIDGLIKKLMTQMNQTFAKGLEEFLLQIKREVAEISNAITQTRTTYSTTCGSIDKQLKQYESQVQELRKQTIECARQQKDILAQLQIQHQEMQVAAAGSPALSLRDRQLLRLSFATPPPGEAGKAMWMLNPEYEEAEKKRRAEEEKATKLKQIWGKIKSENPRLVMEGISAAFELKDQALIREICEFYHKTKGAAHLVNLIEKDQAILLSILSNLASSDLKEEKWKITFITKIVPQLDTKSPLVKDWLPRFDGKLISRLEEAEKILGDSMPDITLILRILYLYRDQCK